MGGMSFFLTIHDIQSTFAHAHDPWIFIPLDQIKVAWQIVYWSSFGLSFLIFPFLCGYVAAPDFEFGAKLVRALWTNLQLYGSIAFTLIAGALALYLTESLTFEGMRGILMCVSNIWCLSLLMLFLGLGLVKVFLLTNRKSRLDYMTNNYKKKSFYYSHQATKEKAKMISLMRELKSIKEQDLTLKHQKMLGEIIHKLASSKWGDEYDEASSDMAVWVTTTKRLVKLNGKAKKRLYKRERAKDLANYNIQQYYYYHDLAHKGEQQKVRGCERIYKGTVEPFFCFVLSIIFFLCALCVVIAETTTIVLYFDGVNSEYAVAHYFFSILLDDAYEVKLGLGMFWILFMGVSAFVGVLQFRLFNLYRVLWHQTDPRSLMFSASWAAQLAPMLAYNFMTITRLEGAALNQVLLVMDVIPLVGVNFQYFVPCLCGLFFVIAFFFECCCGSDYSYNEEETPLTQSPIDYDVREEHPEQQLHQTPLHEQDRSSADNRPESSGAESSQEPNQDLYQQPPDPYNPPVPHYQAPGDAPNPYNPIAPPYQAPASNLYPSISPYQTPGNTPDPYYTPSVPHYQAPGDTPDPYTPSAPHYPQAPEDANNRLSYHYEPSAPPL